MAFSYTLFLALLLLFPGLCGWVALRAGERSDLLTPRPDRPNSTTTLFVVVMATIVGHLLGSAALACQAYLCRFIGRCFSVSFDPNVYRELIAVGRSSGGVPDFAIVTWLLELALIGVFSGSLIALVARLDWIRETWNAADFGWLNPAVKAVKGGDAVVLAYVVTKTEYEGASVAYQGIVQQLALDEDQTISMLVLRRVDRFLVKISAEGLERIDQTHSPIAQMQFHLAEIANVALEIIERPPLGAEIGAA